MAIDIITGDALAVLRTLRDGNVLDRDVREVEHVTIESMWRKSLIEPASPGLFPQFPQAFRVAE